MIAVWSGNTEAARSNSVSGVSGWKFAGLRELVDFADIYSLIAPRPLLICNTDKDTIFPLDGVQRISVLVGRGGTSGAEGSLGDPALPMAYRDGGRRLLSFALVLGAWGGVSNAARNRTQAYQLALTREQVLAALDPLLKELGNE